MLTFFALVALQASPAGAGPRAYDIDLLLNEPHPFATEAPSVRQPTTGRRSARKRANTDTLSHRTASGSLSLFGGVMTDNDWEDFFTPNDIDFGDSTLVGIAASHTFWRYRDKLTVELEGQVIRHFGNQTHWEFNLPLVARWHVLPWDSWLDTSVALGIGPSYASSVPREEVAQDGDSHQWLVYWLAEIELGLPSSPWRGFLRLHHRSGAYGLVADEGGSNVLTGGIRRYY